MTTTARRYDIDWLRVITIGLLLIYHIAIVFQPWGIFIGFVKSDTSWESLWIPMSMLNIWRIPLLFFVSGMGVSFAIRKRNWKQLLRERTQRILVPFIFGMLFIVPIHIFIWQNYYHQELKYLPNPGHLWFLGNIFLYVVILTPVFFYLKRNENGRFMGWMRKLLGNPLGLMVIVIPFVLEAVLMKPNPYELYAMTFHGFILGFLAFFFGFVGILSGNIFSQTLIKWRWIFLLLAVGLYTLRLLVFQLKSPDYLMAIESNMWIFTVFGFGFKYLNRPGKALTYLSQAAYPIYIIHMIFLYWGSILILPLQIPVVWKFVLLIVFTVEGCFASYEFIIRRLNILRPLFGLKSKSREKVSLQVESVKV